MPPTSPPGAEKSGVAEGDMVRAPVLAAQMRRDRERLAGAQDEIATLRDRVRRLEDMPAQRGYERARRTYHALPPALRGAIRRVRGGTSSHAAPAPSEPLPAPRGRAVVIDDHWPHPDRDAGSVDIVHLVRSLARLGFDVLLVAAREHDATSPIRDALVASGIRCLLPFEAVSVEHFLAEQGATLDLCVLCRVYCGGRFLEASLRHALKARIVFDSIDLNFLRLERQGQLEGSGATLAVAREVREREEAIIRACDATIVVSTAELDFLREAVPEALVVELPLARPLTPPVTPFTGRTGIGFIGGFAHAPNVDAIRHFLAEIWPLVLRRVPEMEMTIVGADFPGHLLEGVPGRVRALNHVPDIGPWFEGLRLTVAPLRFGAGAKGKVASSLAAGVPCIATPVAAEGMSLSEASGVIVAADPAAFAARLCEAYADEAQWSRLSAGGLAYAGETLSPCRWRDRLDAMLRQIAL